MILIKQYHIESEFDNGLAGIPSNHHQSLHTLIFGDFNIYQAIIPPMLKAHK